jgi:V/A-type H+-transporting ATPase subunit C
VNGYEYGNTRLRALRSRLLTPALYSELLAAGSIDRLLGVLHDTPYGPDVEAAIARFDGIRRLDEAVRTNLARTLRSMLGFYQDRPAQRVGILVRRWDLYNIRNLIRARARPAGIDEAPPLLVAAGNLGDAELAELAGQRSLRSLIDLMVAWGLPTRQSARRLLAAWPDYEATGELAGLERGLERMWAEMVDDELASTEPDDPLMQVLRTEIDQTNLLTALRLHDAQLAGEPDEGPLQAHLLPGGRLPSHYWEEARAASDRQAVAAVFADAALPAGWEPALAPWVQDGDLVALSIRLDEALTRSAISRFGTGDPLGIDIPVAFTFAKENEARNLRLIGRGLVHGLSPEDVSHALVVAA